MNCFAKTNRNQADLETDDSQKIAKAASTDTTEAESTRKNYDKKWQKMVGSTSLPHTRSRTSKDKDSPTGSH